MTENTSIYRFLTVDTLQLDQVDIYLVGEQKEIIITCIKDGETIEMT